MCKQIVTTKQKDSEKQKDDRIVVQDLILKNFVASETVTVTPPRSHDVVVVCQMNTVVWKTLGEARPPVPPPRALVWLGFQLMRWSFVPSLDWRTP